ncbi:MAG TPA: 2'-5' RNA ligase family protein [Gracilimonas sp.]|uniref:2'-5' RNA ligase family protein n=1 Tax=Gracilimonas sp. TaxID=1974203 RepID=UPI002D90C72C|nr:2'-5' RNA ligase family protein [Gracilimonas sp.]
MSSKTDLFLIAIIPPNPLGDKIQQLKLEVKEKFNSSHSLNAPPHITLLSPFGMDEELGDNLNSLLEVFAQGFQTLEIQLNDFSTFPPRVVFIDVKKSDPLMELQQKLEETARSKPDMFSYNYHEREYHPHITLAFKDLTKANFRKAWKEFEDRRFNEHFLAGDLSLLKHDGEQWSVIKEFSLGT